MRRDDWFEICRDRYYYDWQPKAVLWLLDINKLVIDDYCNAFLANMPDNNEMCLCFGFYVGSFRQQNQTVVNVVPVIGYIMSQKVNIQSTPTPSP